MVLEEFANIITCVHTHVSTIHAYMFINMRCSEFLILFLVCMIWQFLGLVWDSNTKSLTNGTNSPCRDAKPVTNRARQISFTCKSEVMIIDSANYNKLSKQNDDLTRRRYKQIFMAIQLSCLNSLKETLEIILRNFIHRAHTLFYWSREWLEPRNSGRRQWLNSHIP